LVQPFGENLVAGDRWKWTVALADYPADTWRLKYFFRGKSALDITSTASGADHLLDTLPANTIKLSPGSYNWQAVVEKIADATERYELARGSIRILPDMQKATADSGDEFRSDNQIALDNIRKVLQGTASREEKSYEIAGRSLELRSYEELRQMETDYSAAVRREQGEAGVLTNAGPQVVVRFGVPS